MSIDKLAKELEKPFLPKKSDLKEEEVDITKKEFYSKVIDFTNRIKKSYGDLVKSVLIFGSAARGEMKATSDIDLWVVVDDTATKSTEDVNRIRVQIQLLTQQEFKGLHVQLSSLTEFWGWMRRGSPELFNYLRVGLIIYDTGFIKPVQRMLKSGLLPPSEETVGLKTKSAEAIIKRVEAGMKAMIFDLRYAATDACQSVIMHYFKETPDQRHMSGWLEKLVKEKKLEKEYIEKFQDINTLWKDIDHEKIKKIEVSHLQKAMSLASDIIERMKKLLPKELQDVDYAGLI